jgi:hypothetical protein
MKTGKIDIKQEYLMPFHLRVLGYFLIVFGTLGVIISLMILLQSGSYDWLLWLSPVFVLIGAFISVSHYRLIIDPKEKTYTVATRMPFITSGKPESFNYISKIYVNPVKETTTYTTRGAIRHDSTKELYKAFMKLDDGEKIHLDTDRDKSALESRVDDYILKLGDIYQPGN